MFIEELNEGDVVTVEAASGDNIIKLESTVKVVTSDADKERARALREKLKTEHFTIVELLKDNDNVLNFADPKVKCSMIALQDGKPCQFYKVAIAKFKFADLGNVHLIVSSDEARRFNRRNEFRLGITCAAQFKVQRTDGRGEAIMRDISIHGVGFSIKSDVDLEVRDNIVVAFTYDGQEFAIPARVVRRVPTNNNRILIGCVITKSDENISKFINEQQRAQMKLN